jgi:hypothetical protein
LPDFDEVLYPNLPLFFLSQPQVPFRTYVTEMMHAQNTSQNGEETFYHFGMHKDEFADLFAHYERPIFAQSFQHSYSWGLSGDGTV